jgi:3-keto-disaccharide hydrolase
MRVVVVLSLSLCSLVTVVCTYVTAQDTEQPWRSLPLITDGKVAADWKHVGWGKFVVEEDHLRAEPDERGLGLLVYTKEKLGNCQIRVVYRPADARDNAGVHIRMDDGILGWIGKDSIAVKRNEKGKLSPDMLNKMKEASEKEEGAWYAVHHGYEVQIMDSADAFHRTGSIYSFASAADLPPKPASDWRTMIITLQGNLVLVELDGKQLSRFDSAAQDLPPRKNWPEPKRDAPRPEAGYIGLQTHDPGDIVYFKEVSVRPSTKQP